MRKVKKIYTVAYSDVYTIKFPDANCVYANYDKYYYLVIDCPTRSADAEFMPIRNKNREIHKRERRNL